MGSGTDDLFSSMLLSLSTQNASVFLKTMLPVMKEHAWYNFHLLLHLFILIFFTNPALQFSWRATRPGDVLDDLMSLSKNVKDRKEDSTRFISPLQFCIEKQIFQVILIVLSGLLLYNAYAVLSNVPAYSQSQNREYLLNFSLAAGGPDHFAADWCLLTLLRKGCAAASKYLPVSHEANTKSSFVGPILLPLPTIMDGFEVKISLSAMDSANATFAAGLLLLASADGGTTWSVAGSSTLRYLPGGARFLSPEPVPWPRAESGKWLLRADFRPPWPAVAEPALGSGLAGVGLLAIAVLGVLGRPASGSRACCWLCLLLAANSLTAAAALAAGGGGRAAFRPLAEAALLAYVGAGLLFRGGERLFFGRLLAAAAAAVLVRVIDDCALHADTGNLAASPPAAALAAAAWAAVFLLRNEAFLRHCVAAVAADRARHDAEWARLQSDPVELAALAELEAVCQGLADTCAHLPRARQLNRPRIRIVGLMQAGGAPPLPPPAEVATSTGAASAAASDADAAGADSIAERSRAGQWQRGRRSSTLEQLHTFLRWDARDEDFESRNTVPGRADESSPVTSLDQLFGEPPRQRMHPGCDRYTPYWSCPARRRAAHSKGFYDHDCALVCADHNVRFMVHSQQLAAGSRCQDRFLTEDLDSFVHIFTIL
jgi:hypothetical protein